MGLNENIQEKIQEGIALLEQAEASEENHELPTAIFKYQQAAELLSQCNLPREKINAIYDKIAYLNGLAEQQKAQNLQQMQYNQVNADTLQNQAFQLIDQSKNVENNGNFEQAIQYLINAVELLINAGWDESQLQGFKGEIIRIREKAEKPVQKPILPIYQSNDYSSAQVMQPSNQIPTQPNTLNNVNKINTIHQNITPVRKGPTIDELQDQAFKTIDTAKNLEKQHKYQEAINTFNIAVKLLTRAGWGQEQLSGFQVEIEKLNAKISKNQKDIFSQSQPLQSIQPVQPIPSLQTMQPTELMKNKVFPPATDNLSLEITSDISPQSLRDDSSDLKFKPNLVILEEKKKSISEKQDQAFILLDEAKNLEQFKHYDRAIEKYLEAADILNNIGWIIETNRIYSVIESLEEKKEQEKSEKEKSSKNNQEGSIAASNLKPEKINISDEITGSSTNESINLGFSLNDFELKRKQAEERQNEAFSLLDEANNLEKFKRFDEAIEKYNYSISIFSDIGWDDYIPKIQESIKKILKEKEKQKIILEKRVTHKDAVTIQEHSETRGIFESQINQRKKKLIDFEANKEKEKKIQDDAFNLISEGETFVKKMDYDNALLKYNQAVQLLISIGWQDQIMNLREVMKKIQEDKIRSDLVKQQNIVKRMERQKKESDLLEKINSKAKKQEQELHDKKIADAVKFEEQKNTLANKQKDALELLDKANYYSKKKIPDFDTSIELYEKAYSILASIGWKGELSYISEVIRDLKLTRERINKQKSDMEKKKESAIKLHQSFQSSIQNQIDKYDEYKSAQKEKLKIFQDKQGKSEKIERKAFKLMDEADEWAKKKCYIDAAELYQSAIVEFKKISWDSQITHIQKEIQRMYEMQKRHEQEFKLQQEMNKNRFQQEKDTQKKEAFLKKQEKQDISSISSMIKTIAAQKSDLNSNSKIQKDILAGSAFKSEIKKDIEKSQTSAKEKISQKSELNGLKKDAEEDLDEFRRMIQEAAKKTNKK